MDPGRLGQLESQSGSNELPVVNVVVLILIDHIQEMLDGPEVHRMML